MTALHHHVDCSNHDLDAAAAGVGMVPVFQPIVSLPDGATVGYEALARWPTMAGCEPGPVFDHARTVGTSDELDQACIDSAITAALRSPLRHGSLLCVNAEPSTPYLGRPDGSVLARGQHALTVLFEITERGLLTHPAALLRKVSALRSDGFGIALDDVGAHPDSLALLDVIRPDVVKLDLAMVQHQPTREQARTLAAVLAFHERTEAVILAEGIESDQHLEQALAVGATLGQGFLFGRPGPLEHDVTASWSPPARTLHALRGTGSPFDLVADTSTVRTARKQTLIALSHHIEAQAEHAADPPILLTALQSGDYFSDSTRDRYAALARTCPLVVVFGHDMPVDVGSRVRGVELGPADPLRTEWTIVSLGPHHAAALFAREHADDSDRDDGDRRFDFVITYNRSLVTAATIDLLDRVI